MSKVGEIVNLEFTPEEADLVWAKLRMKNFQPTKEGLKEFILDSLDLEYEEGEEHENAYQKINNFLKDNPEVAQMGQQFVRNMIFRNGKK